MTYQKECCNNANGTFTLFLHHSLELDVKCLKKLLFRKICMTIMFEGHQIKQSFFHSNMVINDSNYSLNIFLMPNRLFYDFIFGGLIKIARKLTKKQKFKCDETSLEFRRLVMIKKYVYLYVFKRDIRVHHGH